MERIERIDRRDGPDPVRLTLLSPLERERERQERERRRRAHTPDPAAPAADPASDAPPPRLDLRA
jgi:hypothetical protein